MELFLKIATGRHRAATYFLLVFMVVAPTAFFTDSVYLDWFAWLMLAILGLFVSITGWVTLQEAIDSFSWPQVEAELTSVSISRRSGSSGGGHVYAAKIQCRFEVEGVEYWGTEYDWSASAGSRASAERVKSEVEAMQPLVIRYKPQDPQINVINPGVRLVHFLRIVLGLAMMIVPMLIEMKIIRF